MKKAVGHLIPFMEAEKVEMNASNTEESSNLSVCIFKVLSDIVNFTLNSMAIVIFFQNEINY